MKDRKSVRLPGRRSLLFACAVVALVVTANLRPQGATERTSLPSDGELKAAHVAEVSPSLMREEDAVDSGRGRAVDPVPNPWDYRRWQKHRTVDDVEPLVSSVAQCSALGERFVRALTRHIAKHNTDDVAPNGRVLMYSCESDKMGHFCGGMGDRFRGMITTYFLALLSDRRFELFHPTPLPIQEFLAPNIVNFVPRMSPTDDARAVVARIPVDKSLMRLQRHKSFLRTLDEADKKGVNVLRVQSNSAGIDQFVAKHPRWRLAKEALGLSLNANISAYFGCLYHVLFAPTAELRQVVRAVIPEALDPTSRFIAVQVRVGGSWAPGMRIAEPFRTPPNAVQHFVALLEELRTERIVGTMPAVWFPHGVAWMGNASIFVSSDAPRFAQALQRHFGKDVVRFVDGGFGHTDTLNLADVKPSKFKKLAAADIRETYALTMANHFILGRGSHMVMAQSGFGDTAFWTGRTAASCIFVDMTHLHIGWQHHLSYPPDSGGGSAIAVRNRIVNIDAAPTTFYA